MFDFQPVHEKCVGCKKVAADQTCITYINPSMWWDKRGGCPVATHTGKKISFEDEKKRVGQQKQKKKTRK